jgi:hypothetical protein
MNDYWGPPCQASSTNSFPASGTAKYAQVFEQSDFYFSSFDLSCIEFGYVNDGKLDATFEIFVDANGGTPDDDGDMTLLGSFPTTIYNTGFLQYSTGTVSTPVSVSLSGAETLVVVMSHALSDSPERCYAAGYNQYQTGVDRTFVGGSCIAGYLPYSQYCADEGGSFCYSNWLLELSVSTDSGSSSGDGWCFHVDTKIDYKGVEYTFEELKAGKEPECTVPHTPSSKGVVIFTSCDKAVRVTDTHLMATTKGFQLAYSVLEGWRCSVW